MKVSKMAKIWIDYHGSNSRKNTVRAYEGTIFKFIAIFGDKDIADVDTDDVLSFLGNPTFIKYLEQEFKLLISIHASANKMN